MTKTPPTAFAAVNKPNKTLHDSVDVTARTTRKTFTETGAISLS
jgi:hypothetical protein